MKCLHLFRVLNSSSRICCSRAIQTDGVIRARTRARNVPRKINFKSGLRHTEAALSENPDILEEIQNEEDFENSAELMSEESYMDELDEDRRRRRLGFIITAKKFFKEPPQPSTLSCNERECIRYLHKTDPVQWNVEALSESFPATPEAIKKVLKGKFRFSEEAKRKIDLKVQRNWELLAEGKLEAAPEVLEHLKKFVNRREVLLDQIKKANFYLPEVKEQVVWNNGEMSKILGHYEKAIEKLAQKQELQSGENPENKKPEKLMLQDAKKKNNLPNGRTEFGFPNLKKVLDEIRTNTKVSSSAEKEFDGQSDTERFAQKNSFSDPERLEPGRFNRVKVEYPERLDAHEDEYYANQVKDIENPAFWNKGRASQEKALEDTGRFGKKNYFSNPERLKSESEYYANQIKDIENPGFLNKGQRSHERAVEVTEGQFVTERSGKKNYFSNPERLRSESEYYANQIKDIENPGFLNKGQRSHERAVEVTEGQFVTERSGKKIDFSYPERLRGENEYLANQGKDIENPGFLNAGQTSHEKAVEVTEGQSDTEGSGKKIDFSDPERLRRENEYFAKQVKDIEGTAFWNKGRTSHEKALAESTKAALGGPDTLNRGKLCSSDVYPERIKIPKNKKGSGLTFRVKDCYYDDDGEFLYRVPGMVK